MIWPGPKVNLPQAATAAMERGDEGEIRISYYLRGGATKLQVDLHWQLGSLQMVIMTVRKRETVLINHVWPWSPYNIQMWVWRI